MLQKKSEFFTVEEDCEDEEELCGVTCKESFPKFWEPFKAAESGCVDRKDIDLKDPLIFEFCDSKNLEERRNLEEFTCLCNTTLCNERFEFCGINENMRSFPDVIC